MQDNKTSREQRLAAALRANLHRRKQEARQARQRDADEAADGEETGDAAPAGTRSPGKT